MKIVVPIREATPTQIRQHEAMLKDRRKKIENNINLSNFIKKKALKLIDKYLKTINQSLVARGERFNVTVSADGIVEEKG